jgi:UDP-glucose 4-epimerase
MTTRKPSCIVLGGGGFLGTNLCRRLVASDVRVTAFGRRCLFPQDLEGVEWHQGDFSDTAALVSAIEPHQIVFHLVHSNTPRSAEIDIAQDVRQNVVATLGLLEVAYKLGGKRIVFVSSGGTIYGVAKQVPTPETAATDPITAYGIDKLTIEKYLALYEHHYSTSFRVLRVANPFGPFQLPVKRQGAIAALVSCAMRDEEFEIWGDGSAVRDYIYVDDVIDALVRVAADQSEQRVFNIGSGQGRSLNQVIAAVEAQLGAKLRVRRGQSRAIDVPVSVLAIERAASVVGWQPSTPFDVGLGRTIEWWRKRII